MEKESQLKRKIFAAEAAIELPEIYREKCRLLERSIRDLEKTSAKADQELESIEAAGVLTMIEIHRAELGVAAIAAQKTEVNVPGWKNARDRWRQQLGRLLNAELEAQRKETQAEMF